MDRGGSKTNYLFLSFCCMFVLNYINFEWKLSGRRSVNRARWEIWFQEMVCYCKVFTGSHRQAMQGKVIDNHFYFLVTACGTLVHLLVKNYFYKISFKTDLFGRIWSLYLCFRWYNHLDPAIKKDAWTEEEERTLAYYQRIFGNKWADIASFLPGR